MGTSFYRLLLLKHFFLPSFHPHSAKHLHINTLSHWVLACATTSVGPPAAPSLRVGGLRCLALGQVGVSCDLPIQIWF